MRLASIVYKQWGFLKRSLLVESSYKLAFALDLFASVMPIIAVFFVARLFIGSAPRSLDPYQGDYFGFALIGLGLTQFLNKALDVFSNNIRRAQLSGVLEAVISSRTPPGVVVLHDAGYSFVAAGLHLAAILGVGVGIFGARFANANYPAVLISTALSLSTFVSIGVASAAVIIVLKQGNPIAFVFGRGALLFSGVYFPVEVLPPPMQYVSSVLPMTYALDAVRLSLFAGASLPELAGPLTVLGAISLIGLPGSVWLFHWAIEKGRREGTLLEY